MDISNERKSRRTWWKRKSLRIMGRAIPGLGNEVVDDNEARNGTQDMVSKDGDKLV